MEVSAKLKGARIAAQKARLVADQIRGNLLNPHLRYFNLVKKEGGGYF